MVMLYQNKPVGTLSPSRMAMVSRTPKAKAGGQGADLIMAVCHKRSGRPACVLIQAIYGGDRRIPMMVDRGLWITDSTKGLMKIEATMDEWKLWAKDMEARG